MFCNSPPLATPFLITVLSQWQSKYQLLLRSGVKRPPLSEDASKRVSITIGLQDECSLPILFGHSQIFTAGVPKPGNPKTCRPQLPEFWELGSTGLRVARFGDTCCKDL
uniref:Uncharacterized protein n=1 Tax=Micrurus lemniscatus lemniscatus TaxID=129467 RepID=A0A2D4JD71_MICLE